MSKAMIQRKSDTENKPTCPAPALAIDIASLTIVILWITKFAKGKSINIKYQRFPRYLKRT
jgi:hypothetical protein